MDGPYYLDSRFPFIATDVPAVTLAATMKALYTPSYFPVLGGHYFGTIGKKLRIRLFGRITTGATPGNIQLGVYFGDGTDANGTSLVTSAAVALTASQTNLSWEAEINVHCRVTGNAGQLFADGKALFNNAVVASTLQPLMIPASAPVGVGSIDLTLAKIISVQASRSGSTAESMQVHDMEVVAFN